MRIFVILACLACLNSCGRSKSDGVVKREGKPDYIRLEGESEEKMNQAIAQSRKEIGTFIEALANPKPSQTYFSIKKPFPWQDRNATSHEHIWLSDVSFRDGKFHGRVGNEPVDVKGLKLGDEVELAKEEASDWMIIDDGSLIGGYTIIALRDAMPPDERKEFDAHFPYKIGAK
jgi:uncharacterized protein YegJ (DUF2314 family)